MGILGRFGASRDASDDREGTAPTAYEGETLRGDLLRAQSNPVSAGEE
jgi:hypothetical protein